jgi:protein involved in polysaccharide export with SLBB domain
LLGAISAAGGWRNDRLADRHNVKLTRTMPDGTTTTFQIDATKINQNDWVLRDGDLVIVGERWM